MSSTSVSVHAVLSFSLLYATWHHRPWVHWLIHWVILCYFLMSSTGVSVHAVLSFSLLYATWHHWPWVHWLIHWVVLCFSHVQYKCLCTCCSVVLTAVCNMAPPTLSTLVNTLSGSLLFSHVQYKCLCTWCSVVLTAVCNMAPLTLSTLVNTLSGSLFFSCPVQVSLYMLFCRSYCCMQHGTTDLEYTGQYTEWFSVFLMSSTSVSVHAVLSFSLLYATWHHRPWVHWLIHWVVLCFSHVQYKCLCTCCSVVLTAVCNMAPPTLSTLVNTLSGSLLFSCPVQVSLYMLFCRSHCCMQHGTTDLEYTG